MDERKPEKVGILYLRRVRISSRLLKWIKMERLAA